MYSIHISPIKVPIELPRIVFPITVLPMGVPHDRQCLTRISATCVVEDVSVRLDILTLEF